MQLMLQKSASIQALNFILFSQKSTGMGLRAVSTWKAVDKTVNSYCFG